MLIPSVRKIHNHNSNKVIGYFYSHKMNGLIPWESPSESGWLLHLDANPLVETIQGQPLKVDYSFNRKWHLYTPDIGTHWIKSINRLPTLYEVKSDVVAADEEFKEEANAIGLRLATLGYEFIVIDRKTIFGGNQFKNLCFLKHYADVFVTHRDRHHIADHLLQVEHSTPACLINRFKYMNLSICCIYRLMWDGWLDYDKCDLVGPLLKVHLAEGVKNDYSA